MAREDGTNDATFKYIDHLGVTHFEDIYKEGDKTNIPKVVKMTSFFPRFMEDEDTEKLMDPITKEELKKKNCTASKRTKDLAWIDKYLNSF
jgi:hypothetical protein